MRWSVLVVVIAVAAPVAAIPFVTLVDEVSVEDATGDADINGVPADHIDITHARVATNHTHLQADLGIVDAETAQDSGSGILAGQAYYWISLDFQETAFDLTWMPKRSVHPEAGDVIDTTDVVLLRDDPDGWTTIYEGPAAVDVDASILTASVPLGSILATNGFSPGPGEQVVVESATAMFVGMGQDPHDPAPPGTPGDVLQDSIEGRDDVQFPAGSAVDIEGDVTSAIGIGTARPIRFSNGEATTYHWPVVVTNRAAEDATLVLRAEASEDLEVHAPPTVAVGAASSTLVDVFATAPFAHAHGGSREVIVQVDGEGHHATLPLRVHYLDVPQPSGHHDTVHMHARNTQNQVGGTSWMDTLSDPGVEVHQDMEMTHTTCMVDGVQEDGVALSFPLRPALLIGVDADLEEHAKLTGSLAWATPQPESGLIAELYVYDVVSGSGLGPASDPSRDHAAAMDLPASTGPDSVDFELDLTIPPVLDRLEPGAGRNLGVKIGVCGIPLGTGVGRTIVDAAADTHHVLRDVSAALPLNEYHDRVEIELERGIALQTDDAERTAAPGATMLWNIETRGPGDGRLAVRTLGLHGQLAEVHDDAPRLGDTIPVSIVVPEGAGDTIEVIVDVSLADDPTRHGAMRLIVDVDPRSTADDAPLVEALRPDEKSPHVGAAAVLAAIGAWAALRRRLG